MHKRWIWIFVLILMGCGRKEPPAPVEIGPGRPDYQNPKLYRGSTEPLALNTNAASNVAASEDLRPSTPEEAKPSITSERFVFPLASRKIVQNPPPSTEQGLNVLAEEGELFWAIGEGSVVYAGFDQELGNTVIIRHPNKWISIYAHAQKLSVQTGQTVTQKQTLGRVGKTGQTEQSMLHFELRQESKNVNPMDFIR